MIKLPAREDGNWTVQYANEKLPDIISTRNLNFDREGFLRLSHPTVSFFSDSDDADFGVPLFYGETSAGNIYRIWTDETSFHFSPTYDSITGPGVLGTLYGGRLTVTQDTTTNVPTVTAGKEDDSDAVIFNGEMHVSQDGNVLSVDLGSSQNTWTSRITGLSSIPHPMCLNPQRNALVVGNGNVVHQYNTSYTDLTSYKLTMPADFDAKIVKYNNGYIAVGTHDDENLGGGALFVWVGNSTAANYFYPIGNSTIHAIVPYRGSFLIYTGGGQVLYWTPTELQEATNLPLYYRSVGVNGVGNNVTARNASTQKDGGIGYFHLGTNLTTVTEQGQDYLQDMPTGIYCYDPVVGFYHRHAATAIKVVVDVVATADVNTTDDQITVTAAPDTGTPVRYYCADSATAIAGLDDDALYYTIKVDATTIQLAASYQDAIDGTEIDLTGTGNNNQVLQFYKKSDFGQSYANASFQGTVQSMERSSDVDGGVYIDGMFYGANVQLDDTSTAYKCGGYVMPDTENRGYFVTTRMQSAELQEDWQKVFIKHKKLVTALDKIVVKYRTDTDRDPIVKIKYIDADRTLGGAITWSDSDTFTSTDAQFANVLAGDEVEIVQGAGAGYCIHITSISEAGGTYTVNLDEAVKNISASDTARCVVQRWNYQTTLDNATITNEDGYSEVALGVNGVKSKNIQFKIELRGEDVEIEELLVAHTLHKPVA